MAGASTISTTTNQPGPSQGTENTPDVGKRTDSLASIETAGNGKELHC